MGLLNFFREDFSEIIGAYFDEDKIYLARLTKEVETAEIPFDINAESSLSVTEQLAEKIAGACVQRGWRKKKVGLCLRDGEAATFQTEFGSVPPNEIESAVKIWAVAHVGKEPRYTSIKFDEEIWMEALPNATVEEYAAAWRKFSMTLCALTEFPEFLEKSAPLDRATFAAEIVRDRKAPNILAGKIGSWNVSKISMTAAIIFVLVMAGVSAKLANDYNSAVAQAVAARNNLEAQHELILLKESLDADVVEMKRLNALAAAQDTGLEKFNALLKIGRVAGEKIILQKIRTSGDSLELEGSAENPDAVKNYLSQLKSALKNIRLEKSVAAGDKISFAIRANL